MEVEANLVWEETFLNPLVKNKRNKNNPTGEDANNLKEYTFWHFG